MHTPGESELGKITTYPRKYDKSVLFPIPRASGRREVLCNQEDLPFTGYDFWNAWEVSWLNRKGKPCVAIGTIEIPAESPNLIESKSLKLYFNSFNGSRFSGPQEVVDTVVRDLSEKAGALVKFSLSSLEDFPREIAEYGGELIDDLDIDAEDFSYNPDLLMAEEGGEIVSETLYSNLLKSNCPVTNQPDWAGVCVTYTGKKLNRESLLRYLISFREHNEFHEQCAERIFLEVLKKSEARDLIVECHYTRRGGLDISPVRRLPHSKDPGYRRFIRQ